MQVESETPMRSLIVAGHAADLLVGSGVWISTGQICGIEAYLVADAAAKIKFEPNVSLRTSDVDVDMLDVKVSATTVEFDMISRVLSGVGVRRSVLLRRFERSWAQAFMS